MRLGRWFDKVFVTREWGLEDGSLAPILRRDTVVRHLELHYWDNGDGKIFEFCWAPTLVETVSSGSLRNLVSETTVKNTRGRYLMPITCTWTRVCEHLFTVMQYTHKHPDGLSITFSTWEMSTPGGSTCPSLPHIYHHLKAWASQKGSLYEFAYVYFNSNIPVWSRDAPLLTTHDLSVKIKTNLLIHFKVKIVIQYSLSYLYLGIVYSYIIFMFT